MPQPRRHAAAAAGPEKRMTARWRLLGAFLALAVGAGLLAQPTRAQSGAASAKGTLSSGGESSSLEHISLGTLGPERIIVLLSDVAMDPPCDVYGSLALAETQPFKGVLFTVDRETLDLATDGGLNSLIFPGVESYEGYGAIQGGLSLEREADQARGQFQTTASVGEARYEIAAELSFPLEIPEAPIAPRSVAGADSETGRRFAALVDAVMAADFETVKGLTASELRDQMDQVDPAEAGEALASFAEFLIPEKITITDTEVEGDRATLTAEGVTQGCPDVETSTGRIELVRESGEWKIASVKFES